MAIPDNYIDKITKGNDSRMISPAADMVRVNNDNFDGETLDEVLDDVYTKSEVDTKVAEAGSGAVSVTTNQDGTFTIHVGDTDYTINLNHTHENMAKLIVCEESDLPSTLDPATIYAITDSGETEIEKLIIRGMEFAGGGGTPSTEPKILSPIGTQIDFNGASTKTVTVRASNLSEALTIAVTGMTASLQTISANDAENGVQLTLTKGQNFVRGTLRIYSSEVDKSWNVIDSQGFQSLAAVKLTGSQWLKTDYFPNPDTEFELDCQFVANSHTEEAGLTPNGPCPYFISCAHEGNNRFNFQVGSQETTDNNTAYRIACYNNTVSTRCEIMAFNDSANHSGMTVRSTLAYRKQESSMSMTFNNAATTKTVPLKENTMLSELAIGHSYYFNAQFNSFDLIVYEFKIIENGTIVRDYKPVTLNGVPGLYDYVNNNFISSETNVELVPIS